MVEDTHVWAGEEMVRPGDVRVDSEVGGEPKSGPGFVSITQAAKLNSVTRQAIYVAIKQKKLKASKTTRWEISLEDLEEYRKNRYSRKKSVYNGELIFDNEKGFFSVGQVAERLGVPVQKIYYATRTGTITGTRKGAAWVIHESEIVRYKEEYLDKRKSMATSSSLPKEGVQPPQEELNNASFVVE